MRAFVVLGLVFPYQAKRLAYTILGRHSAVKSDSLLEVLWPPYEIGQAILFFPCGFFTFSSPNLSGSRLDVYHTSTHDMALVQI